jgi:hypothetical protein
MQGSKHSSIYPGIFHLSRKIKDKRGFEEQKLPLGIDLTVLQ